MSQHIQDQIPRSRMPGVRAIRAAIVLLLAAAAASGCSSSSPASSVAPPVTAASPAAGASAATPPTPTPGNIATGVAQPCVSATAAIYPSHCTPQDAVQGLLTDELAGYFTQACGFIVPSSQSTCQQATGSQTAATGNPTVDGAMISGNEALVEVTGSVCVSGSCSNNGYPGTGMPQSQDAFAQVYAQVMSASSGGLSPVPCIQQNGLWYVNAQ